MKSEKEKDRGILRAVFEIFSITFSKYILKEWMIGMLILIEGCQLLILPLTYISHNIYANSTMKSILKNMMKYSFMTSQAPLITFAVISAILWVFILGFLISFTLSLFLQKHQQKRIPKFLFFISTIIIQGFIVIEKLISTPIAIMVQMMRNNFISYESIYVESKLVRNIEYSEGISEEGTYIICVIIAIVTLILLLLMVVLVLTFSYDINPLTKVSTSFESENISLVKLLLKVLLVTTWAFDPKFEQQWMHLVIISVLGIILILLHIYYPPLKLLLLSNLSIFISALFITTYITAFLGIIKEENLIGTMVTLVFLSAYLLFLLHQIGDIQMNKQLVQVTNYSSSIYMIQRIFKLLSSQTIPQYHYARFASSLTFHSYTCTNPNCNSREILDLLDEKRDISEMLTYTSQAEREKQIVGIFKYKTGEKNKLKINPVHYFIFNVFDCIQEKYPRKEFVNILRSYFDYYILGHTCRAFNCITLTQINKSSFKEKFYAFHLRRIIEESHLSAYLSSDDENYSTNEYDISQFISYERNYNKCIKAMEEASVFSINFWEYFLQEMINHMDVIQLGKRITKYIKEVDQSTNKIFAFPETNYHFLIKLLNFQFFVAHNEKLVFDILERIRLKSFNLRIRKENLGGKLGCSDSRQSLKISLEMDKQGMIMDTSYEIEEVLGYSRDALCGRYIHLIMPDSIQERHNLWMREFLDNLEGRWIGNRNEVYLRRKEEYYIKSELTLRTIPNLVNGLFECLAIIEKQRMTIEIKGTHVYTKKKPLFLLADLGDEIFGFCKHCMKYLRMGANSLGGNSNVKLMDLLPKLQEREFFQSLTGEQGVIFPFNPHTLSDQDGGKEPDDTDSVEWGSKTGSEVNFAWGRLLVREYGDLDSHLHMGYKVLELILIESSQDLARFHKLLEKNKELDLHTSASHSLIYSNICNSEGIGEEMEGLDAGEEDGLLGVEEEGDLMQSVSSSVGEIMSERNKLLLYKRQLEEAASRSKNRSMQILVYICYVGMLLLMILGYMYITNKMKTEERNFKLLEMAAKRLDRGGISIPMIAVIVENFITYKQFIYNDTTMEEQISIYRNYFSTAGDILLFYHNRIQKELTAEDKDIWNIERTPVSLREMNHLGNIHLYDTDLTTLINLIAGKLIPLSDKIAPTWLQLKAQYQVDKLFPLRRDLYYQSENGFYISRIEIDVAIQKYIDIFLEANDKEELILITSLSVAMVISAIICITVFIKTLIVLKAQARSLTIYAYIPEGKISELLEYLYTFKISKLWATRESIDTGNLFENFRRLLKSEGEKKGKKGKKGKGDEKEMDIGEYLARGEESKEEEHDSLPEGDSKMNLRPTEKDPELVEDEEPQEVEEIDFLHEEIIQRKVKQLRRLNRSVLNLVILITIFILLCFIGVFYPHSFIINSYFELFEESSFLFKTLSKRHPYLAATWFLDEMAFNRNDTTFMENQGDFTFTYYYNSILQFEKNLLDFKKKRSNLYPRFVQTVTDFNDGEKYFQFLMTETVHDNHKAVVEWCTNRFDNLAKKGLISIIMAYIGHYLKLNRAFLSSSRSFEELGQIILNDDKEDLGWFGYYCALPGIYHQMNVFLEETWDSLNYYKTLELLGFMGTLLLLTLIYLVLFRYIIILLSREINFRNGLVLNLPLGFIIDNAKLQKIMLN